MKIPKPHVYDDREIAFLRGEPMADDFDEWEDDWHGIEVPHDAPHDINCECEACQNCESYQYVYSPRPWWVVAVEAAAIGFLLGVVVRAMFQ